jgi:hypothetical protein
MRWHAAAAAAAALATSEPVRAADDGPAKARLEWTREEGAEDCIDGERLKRAVEEILGRSVFVEKGNEDVVVRGSVAPERDSGTAWRVRLYVRRRSGRTAGTRELTTQEASCAALDGPLPLVVAMMVDLRRESATIRAPPLATTEAVVPRSRLASASATGWGLASSAAPAMAIGLLPGIVVGARFDVGVVPPRWPRMALSMSIWPSARELTGDRGASFSAWYAGLSACPSIVRRPVRLDACAGISVGVTTATGVGLDVTRQDVRATGLAEARAVFSVPFAGPIGGELALGGGIPFTRTTFVYTDTSADRRIYEPPPAFALGSLGLRASLP